jgi:hypothetical protein
LVGVLRYKKKDGIFIAPSAAIFCKKNKVGYRPIFYIFANRCFIGGGAGSVVARTGGLSPYLLYGNSLTPAPLPLCFCVARSF